VVDGQLYTYGSNKYNQLGRPTGSDTEQGAGAPPVALSLDSEVVGAAMGGYHSCAILADGSLLTWGWGGSFWYGQGALGHGDSESAETPKLVEKFDVHADAGLAVSQVACGAQHTLVLTRDGGLFSTGKGAFGLLGRGDTHDDPFFEEIDYFAQSNDSVLNPDEPVVIKKVDAGDNFSAVLSQSGELWVWGRNDYGQLGLGEEAMGDMYSAERYPRLVRFLAGEGHKVVDFACGSQHLVALTDSGDIFEWGNRLWLEPHLVARADRYKEQLEDIVKVAAGDKYSFALTREGRLFSWGPKASGCLAQGQDCPKTVVEPTPVSVELFGRQKVVDVVATKRRCAAITLEDELLA
jgi:alpha-tubulin suppressor-like RCC1 family protein